MKGKIVVAALILLAISGVVNAAWWNTDYGHRRDTVNTPSDQLIFPFVDENPDNDSSLSTYYGMNGSIYYNEDNDFAFANDTTQRCGFSTKVDGSQNLIDKCPANATPNDLVSYWTLDEGSGDATDFISGNDGTNTNNPTQGVAGQVGSAYDFDGSDQYVDIGTISSVNTSSGVTVTAWINTNTDHNGIIFCGDDNNDDRVFQFKKKLAGQIRVLYSSDGDLTTLADTIVDSGAQPNDTWIFVAFTSNSSGVELFINGSSVASNSSVMDNGNPPHYIGQYANIGDNPFDGTIDDVRLYNRALSPSEIQQLYNATKPVAGYDPTFGSEESLPHYNVSGYVENSFGNPVDDVSVTNNVTVDSNTTDANGHYKLSLQNNTYKIKASKTTYYTNSITVTINGSDLTHQNLTIYDKFAYRRSTINTSASNQMVYPFVDEDPDGNGRLSTYYGQNGSIHYNKDSDFVFTNTTAQRCGFATKVNGSQNLADKCPASASPNGLISYWTLDEQTGDAIDFVSGYNGTVSVETQGVTGQVATAYEFSEPAGNYIDFGDKIMDGQTNFTVTAWVNPDTINSSAPAHNADGNAIVDKSGSDDDNFAFYLGNSSELYLYIDTGTDYSVESSTNPIGTGVWTHVTGVYNGSALILYVNGTQVATSPASGTLISNTNPLYIGNSEESAVPFNGTIDDVRIYDPALSSAEIQTLYNATKPVTGYDPIFGGEELLSPVVSLDNPPDEYKTGQSIDFEYTPYCKNAVNATLYTNESGWSSVKQNTTPITENASNTISYEVSGFQTIKWNVEICNNMVCVFAHPNRTLTTSSWWNVSTSDEWDYNKHSSNNTAINDSKLEITASTGNWTSITREYSQQMRAEKLEIVPVDKLSWGSDRWHSVVNETKTSYSTQNPIPFRENGSWYMYIMDHSVNTYTDLWEKVGNSNWTQIADNVTTYEITDVIRNETGYYYAYGGDINATLYISNSTYDKQNFTEYGVLATGCGDPGAFYDEETGMYHLFCENGTVESVHDGERVRHMVSPNGRDSWEDAGTAVESNYTDYDTGDPRVTKIGDYYHMNVDWSLDVAHHNVKHYYTTNINATPWTEDQISLDGGGTNDGIPNKGDAFLRYNMSGNKTWWNVYETESGDRSNKSYGVGNRIEFRLGVDEDGDGAIDSYTNWTNVKIWEYDENSTTRVLKKQNMTINETGYGFEIQYRMDDIYNPSLPGWELNFSQMGGICGYTSGDWKVTSPTVCKQDVQVDPGHKLICEDTLTMYNATVYADGFESRTTVPLVCAEKGKCAVFS